jgi:hypothetical protein
MILPKIGRGVSMRVHQSFRAVVRFAVVVATVTVAGPSWGASVTINFDTTATGSPLVAPSHFIDTTPLTQAYSSLGVHFSGQGSILNAASNFGIQPRSGSNFLAFNGSAGYGPPETISFDAPQFRVSMFVASGGPAADYSLQAFDGTGALLNTTTLHLGSSNTYSLLSVDGAGIRSVRLSYAEMTADNTIVVDDLTFTTSTPLPSAATAGMVLMGGLGLRRRRRRAA